MRHLIVGTAGHIDHGKTQLIKALTGVNTDRLKEEQERGISIELGFAKLELPSGRNIGIVDVPGHERFVKNMVAGASGIDMVLLIIAADDGVMPQTKEHLAIIDLLGVNKGIVAITKSDLVDKEWLDAVREEVKDFLSGSSLSSAPVVAVSSVTGDGLTLLKQEIEKLADELEEHDERGEFRMPIDRVFILKGIGTVVTGTLWSGQIKVQDQVAILPKDFTAKVRSIEVHSEFVDVAHAGQRVALNLAGVDRMDIDRGDFVLPPSYLASTHMFDAEYRHLAGSKQLKSRTRVRVHHGTSEVLGRIVLLDCDELEPGAKAFVQLRLEEPIVPKFQDRFIVRAYSPIHTIGGGIILDSHPIKHRGKDSKTIEELKIRLEGSAKEIVNLVFAHGLLTEKEAVQRAEMLAPDIKTSINALLDEKKLLVIETEGTRRYITSSHYAELRQELEQYLADWRKKNPIALGVNKETVRTQLLWDLPTKTADVLLNRLMVEGIVVIEGDLVREPGHELQLNEEQAQIKRQLAQIYAQTMLQPPLLALLEEQLGRSSKELMPILKILEAEGTLIQIQRGLFFSKDAYLLAVEQVRNFAQKHGKITVADFRDLVGTSRKYAVPLLEYMDLIKITRREGDFRVLRQ